MLFWNVIFPPFNQEVVETLFPLNLDNLMFTLTSVEFGRSDTTWPPRLGHIKPRSFYLAVLENVLSRSSPSEGKFTSHVARSHTERPHIGTQVNSPSWTQSSIHPSPGASHVSEEATDDSSP